MHTLGRAEQEWNKGENDRKTVLWDATLMCNV
jgi:hypothetical protein